MSKKPAVKKIDFFRAADVRAAAAKDHVTITEISTPTDWYGIEADGELIAVGGVAQIREGHYRVRAEWAAPENRDALDRIIDALVKHVPAGASMDVVTFETDRFATHGWERDNTQKTGATRMTFTKPGKA